MILARGMRNNNPLNIIKSLGVWTAGSTEAAPHLLPKTWVQDDSANRGTVGP